MTEIQSIKGIAAALWQSGKLLTASDAQIFALAVDLHVSGLRPNA